MKANIRIVKQRFTGGIHADHHGVFSIDTDSMNTLYTAEPGPQVDRAWGQLLSGNEKAMLRCSDKLTSEASILT